MSPVDISTLSKERQFLVKTMEAAAKRQDYKTAASCKRELEALNSTDPFYLLNEQLKQSIAEERFEEASRLKRAISDLEGELGCSMPLDDSELTGSSNTVTRGIRVRIQSAFQPKQSAPQLGQWFFSYKVSISNESDAIVQIKTRHWSITDANGREEEVKGPGVVGFQPILLPGKSFEYESACPLRTPTGSQEGALGVWVLSEEDGEFKGQFEAKINRFKHDSTTKQK